jgi:hypothetical protein
MSLRSTFDRLYKEAGARQTADRPGEAVASLRQGATIRVRVHDRRRQVILGRQGAPVGEGEVATFRRDGRVPAEATREDYAPTATRWFFVALRWETPQTSFTGMPEAELPESLDKVADAPTPQQGAEGAAPNISEL